MCVALVTSLLFKDHRGLSEEIYYVIDTQMTLDPMTWDFYGPSTSHIDFQPKQKFLKAIREMIVVFDVRDSFCTRAHRYESFRDRNRWPSTTTQTLQFMTFVENELIRLYV